MQLVRYYQLITKWKSFEYSVPCSNGNIGVYDCTRFTWFTWKKKKRVWSNDFPWCTSYEVLKIHVFAVLYLPRCISTAPPNWCKGYRKFVLVCATTSKICTTFLFFGKWNSLGVAGEMLASPPPHFEFGEENGVKNLRWINLRLFVQQFLQSVLILFYSFFF